MSPPFREEHPVGRIGGPSRRILSHTADTGIEATADSLPGLMVELATAMFETMASGESTTAPYEIEVEASAPTPEDLVVEVLSELLYESEVEDLFLCEFEAATTGTLELKLTARGIPMAEIELSGPPIKAVTYHDIEVTERADGFYGRVYLDV